MSRLSVSLRATAVSSLVLCLCASLAAQSPIQYVYDEIGRLIAVIDRSGDTATYTYDAVGNILSIGRQRVRWCGRQRNGSGFDSRRFRDQGDWLDAVRDLSRV